MTESLPTAGPAPHLMDEILALLTPLQAMHRRHQEELDVYRNTDGEVIEDQRRAYEGTRESTAMEASDTLGIVVQRLALLASVPTRRAFTVALTSPGHEEGALPWLFVVLATDLDDAHRTLSEMPSYKQWLEEIAPLMDGDGELVAAQSHPGTRAPGSYIDLRHEQARVLAERAPT
ncbi:hypothetical protein C8250_009450 [Streptomyces sp. So13.3]|uniref:hypothetical protein n=1 Tax=Streptomyces sp. So13.3 TaxID=2136173 RepID=UPI001106CFCF|nr:hypothetical protein [Streptomyces sp. So13.3]QNA72101.1 hypothetical protein C8250_009450 [Streptomyces sp. So13.3]